jgi:hypothetical protein
LEKGASVTMGVSTEGSLRTAKRRIEAGLATVFGFAKQETEFCNGSRKAEVIRGLLERCRFVDQWRGHQCAF